MPREYKSIGYKHRQYEDMANILKSSADKADVVSKMENMFAMDNPRFDRSRFRKAAGY